MHSISTSIQAIAERVVPELDNKSGAGESTGEAVNLGASRPRITDDELFVATFTPSSPEYSSSRCLAAGASKVPLVQPFEVRPGLKSSSSSNRLSVTGKVNKIWGYKASSKTKPPYLCSSY